MKIKVRKDEKDAFEFVLLNERHTFPSLLRQALLMDKTVEFCAYKLEHPMDPHSVFIVRTDGKSARKAVSDALKAIEDEFSDLQKEMKKAFKAKK